MSNQVEMDVDIEITPEIEKFLDEIGELFDPEKVEQIARNTGFVKRKSKLTGHLFLVVFTFAMNTYGTPTLKQLVGLLKLVANVKIKREGFYQRIKEEAVVFFQKMLSEAVKINVSKLLDVNILNVFERVIILDSSVFQLPEELAEYFRGSGGSASKSAVKIQFGYDLKSSQFFYVLQDGTCPDNSYQNSFINEIQEGDLNIRDLGYSNLQVFIEMDQKGAYYMSRLKTDVRPYQLNDEGELVELDLESFLQKFDGCIVEIDVYIKKGDLSVPTRLVIEAVPTEIKAQRLRKLNQTSKKKGRVTKKRTKLFQGFNLYISNIPYQMARFTTAEFEDFKSSYPNTVSLISEHVKVRQDYVYIDCNRFPTDLKVDPKSCSALRIAVIEILAAANFRPLYSIRWQIELIFKNWKSNFALDKITGKKPERIRCMVYAKLLYIFIATKIIFVAKSYAWLHHRREVSDLQAGQEFKILSSEWLRVAIRRPHETKQMLLSILETLIYECLKSKQNTRTYPLDTLEKIFHN